MEREFGELRRENAMGEYAHAGLGIAVGAIIGALAALLLHSPAFGLVIGAVVGLFLEVILEIRHASRRRGVTLVRHRRHYGTRVRRRL